MGALSKTCDAGRNLICGPSPDEGFGILIVDIEVFANRGLQFFHAAEDSATNPLIGDFGKPALYQVDPRAVGRSVVEVKAWSFGELFPYDGRFMRAVVVQDDINVEVGGRIRLDGIEKPAKFLRTMAMM